jgi:pseudomonalisin/xanthomonalisin
MMARTHATRRKRLRFLALCTALAFPVLSHAGWISTNTKALTFSNATQLGAAPQAQPMHIALGLKLQNQTQLNNFLQHINSKGDPLFGATLTPDQFTTAYSPTAQQAQSVVDYLTQAGFSNVTLAPNRLLVTADGTVANVQSAFGTQITQFQLTDRVAYANTLDAQVPAALGNVVLSVLGLQNMDGMHGHLVHAAATPALPSTYGAPDFQRLYDAGSTPTGSATPIAIFTEGDLTQVITDLRAYEAMYNLPQVPYSIIPTGAASTDVSGQDEWDLDTQSSTGIAGNVKQLYLYDATSMDDADLAASFNRFVTDNLAKAGNASFGGCDLLEKLSGDMATDDQIFAQANAQGQTIFASSGDAGAACTVAINLGLPDSGPIDTEYPASSPYVTAVGGTTLIPDTTGNYYAELAWDAGGGGVSIAEPSQPWQKTVVGTLATVSRNVPDVAMDADPNSGALVIVNGQSEGIGGTSLSSPLALGVWARIESAHNNKLGFASPLLYGLAKPATLAISGSVSGFHDVILGTNGLYLATPGYDDTTGLGTFDISAVNALLPTAQ